MRNKQRILFLIAFVAIGITAIGDSNYNTILFTANTKDKLGKTVRVLYRMKTDGSARQMLTSPETPRVRTSSVSSLGKKIAVLIKYRIHVMDWNATNNVDITPIPREHFQPCWSPDGKQIAFVTDRNNDSEVYLMNADGSNAQNLTWSSSSSDMSPTWSPDGKQIAFISNRKGKFELYTMNKAGFSQRKIMSLDGDIREPAWGVNNKIAFALDKGGVSNIYTVDSNGENLKKMTNDQVWIGQPAWNWNASKLAFVSTKSGNPDIWTLDIKSGITTNITKTPENDEFYPSWVPKQISDTPLTITDANLKGTVLPRPRMLFTSNTLPNIRKRFEKEPYKKVWLDFLKRCDALLDPNSPQAKKVKKSIAETKANKRLGLYNRAAWIDPVFNLSFSYQLTGDRKYGEQAVKWLLASAEEHRQYHGVMQLEYKTACAYDWLYDIIPEKQRDALTKLLEITTKLGYFNMLRHNLGLGPLSKGKSNIGVYMAGAMGSAALTLSGEPGSNPNWLAAAIRLTTMSFNNWVDEKGCCIEGFSYFAAPLRQIMPFVISLKINHIGENTYDSNLKKFPSWMAVSAAQGVTETTNIGDCDSFAPWIPLGLLALYPNDQTLKKLWNQIPRGETPKPDVKSLLWWKPSQGGGQTFTGLPKAEIFYNQGYVVLRSGYDADAPMMTLCAPREPGHTHAECGSVMLYGYGARFLVDPGQGVSDADYHNQPLINGRGRGFSFKEASKDLIAIDANNKLGAIASADLKEAFAGRVDLYSDYAIPCGWLPIKYGKRYLAMIHNDTDNVPPYFILYDNIKVDKKKHRFEQLFMLDLGEKAKIGDHQFVVESALEENYFSPNPHKKGKISYSFDTTKSETYQIWLYVNSPGRNHCLVIDDKPYNGKAAPTLTRRKCWQWQQMTTQKGETIKVRLSEGEHALDVYPSGAGSTFATIALVPDSLMGLSGTFTSLGDIEKNSIVLKAKDGKLEGDSYSLKKELKRPSALFSCLNSAPVNITKHNMSYRTRFYGQKKITLPQIRTERTASNPNFLTFIYPHSEGMEQPKIKRDKNNLKATITWKNAVDIIAIDKDGSPSITRTRSDGSKLTLKTKKDDTK